MNYINSSKNFNYFERWKSSKIENQKLWRLLEESNQTISHKIKDYKAETELLTNLLLEIMPVVKNQFNLDDYQSRDFKSIRKDNSIKNKENLLLKI